MRSAIKSAPTSVARVAMPSPSSSLSSNTTSGERPRFAALTEGLRPHVHGRAERQDLREPSNGRIAQPDAAMADARADQPGLVGAVHAHPAVAAGERLELLGMRREAEGERPVRATRIVRLQELDDVEEPAG